MISHSELSDNMRASLNERLSSRYKIRHLSEDSGLPYHQLYRFLKGKQVSESFINQVWSYLNVLAKWSISHCSKDYRRESAIQRLGQPYLSTTTRTEHSWAWAPKSIRKICLQSMELATVRVEQAIQPKCPHGVIGVCHPLAKRRGGRDQ